MSSVTSADHRPAVGQALHVDGGRAGRAHLGELQVAERQAGELGGLVPEDLGRGLAPVVALQQGGEVVGPAARGEPALVAELRPGRLGGAVEQLTLLVCGRPPGRPSSVREPSAEPPSGSRTGISGATPVVVAMSVDATAP